MSSLYYQRKPVPEGFEEMLHDLIKEILRNQPEEIEKFCYNYFDKMIRKRASDNKPKTENEENMDPNLVTLQHLQDRFVIEKGTLQIQFYKSIDVHLVWLSKTYRIITSMACIGYT
jgi:hypothetical protein